VFDCSACGYAHLDALPDSRALDDFYATAFWQAEKPGALAEMHRDREWWYETYCDWLTLLERYVPIGRRHVVDVGCGYGYFLRAAFFRGWDVDGIDPSLRAVQYAETLTGARPWCGTWEDGFTKQWPAISALWLVEHLPDPARFLEWAHRHLYADGALLLVVPNDFSAIQMRANKVSKRPFWWIHYTHMNYFNWRSIETLLVSACFRVVERTTMYPMEQYILEGHDYTADSARGAKVHQSRIALDMDMGRERRMDGYAKMAHEGRGRECVIVAVRE
jgi:SAM-dependent methyltransferase